jgi:hypothetical protein
MKETIRASFSHSRWLCILLCLCGIALINILPLPCFGVGVGYSEPVFSITSTNEPLYRLLERISKITSYQIEITKNWENKLISANIENATLEEAIKKVIKLIGSPSHAIVKNDSPKKVEIIISGVPSGYSSAGTKSLVEPQQRQTQEAPNLGASTKRKNDSTVPDFIVKTDPIDRKVPPPEIASPEVAPPGMVQQLPKAARLNVPPPEVEKEPWEIEIIPPD